MIRWEHLPKPLIESLQKLSAEMEKVEVEDREGMGCVVACAVSDDAAMFTYSGSAEELFNLIQTLFQAFGRQFGEQWVEAALEAIIDHYNVVGGKKI